MRIKRSMAVVFVMILAAPWLFFDPTGLTSRASAAQDPNATLPGKKPAPAKKPAPIKKPIKTKPTATPTPTPDPRFARISVRVRSDNSSNGWTNTGLIVRRGQRLRFTASGRVNLGNGLSATPAGLADTPDPVKLMHQQPTGGLIAVIGDDNDDFIFIGRTRDFVSQRDGVLFLGVNEGKLDDNSESFEVIVEFEIQQSTSTGDATGQLRRFDSDIHNLRSARGGRHPASHAAGNLALPLDRARYSRR